MTVEAVLGTEEARLRAALVSHYELDWLGVLDGTTLFADSTRVRTRDGGFHWKLNDTVRRAVVRRATRAELRAAWSRIPRRPTDDRQWAIDQYIGIGEPVELDTLSLPRLRAVAWLARWCGDAVPRPDALARHLGVAELLDPLRALVGNHFVGRADLLRVLEEHLVHRAGPVVVHGIGGIGKSAAVARHLLDAAANGHVVCYLNFDHSALDPNHPASLVAAMARQLAPQLGPGNDAARLAERCHDVLRTSEPSLAPLGVGEMLTELGALVGTRRLVVVFDTFEEVQRRDPHVRRRFAGFHEALRRQVGSLVVAGRSPAPELSGREVHLTGLDRDDAFALLRDLLPGRELDVRRIVEVVGTSPLALRLAAGVVREGPQDDALRDIALHRGAIEGELYRRLLGHIRDPDVRRIAHPGLTLRRITPELIRHVLAEPCGVDVGAPDRARELFDGLAREAMLVERSADHRVVVHRADVRRVMLRRLAEDEPAAVRQIHHNAIEFYQGRDGATARAEELYHRLMLGQDRVLLDDRWDDAALTTLVSSVDELPAAAKVYLAAKSPTLTVSEDDLREADTEVRRGVVARRAGELLAGDEAAEALAELDRHVAETGDGSLLVVDLRVRALELLDRHAEALEVARAGRERAGRAGATTAFVAFTVHSARLRRHVDGAGDGKRELGETLAQVRGLPRTPPHLLSRLRLLVCLLQQRHYGMPLGDKAVRESVQEAVEIAGELPLRDIQEVPGLLRDLAGEVGEHSPRLLQAALVSLGLPTTEAERLDAELGMSDNRSLSELESRYTVGTELSIRFESDVPSDVFKTIVEAYQSESDALSSRTGPGAEPHLGPPEPASLRELMYRARTRRDRHDTAGAIAAWEECARIATRRGLPQVAAVAQEALGDLAQETGDLPAALRWYARAEMVYRRVPHGGLLLDLRVSQAQVLVAAGLADEASFLLQEVLPELRTRRRTGTIAVAELTAAAASLLYGDAEQARALAGSAERRFVRLRDRRRSLVARLTRARAETVLVLEGRPLRAPTVERALKLADELGKARLPDEATTARLLAVRLALAKGSWEDASAVLGRVRRPSPRVPITTRMTYWLCRAEIARAKGDRAGALRAADRGLEELARTRVHLGSLDMQSAVTTHGSELGELAVGLALDDGDPAVLFRWLERTRAQTYRYLLPFLPEDAESAERFGELRALNRSRQRLLLDGGSVEQVAGRIEALERDLARLGWSATGLRVSRPVAEMRHVRERLGDRALVSYVASDDDLVALVVTDDGAAVVPLGSAAAATEDARRLHADLDALAPDHLPPALGSVISSSARRQAERLDLLLLAPIRDIIGDRDLVIIPTGALYVVPWSALPSLRGRPVVVAPSATAWLSAETAEPRFTPGRVVLVRGPGLPAAVRELDELATLLPDSHVLSNPTVSRVLAAMDGASLVHIAAHGDHSPGNPLFSRLELADGPLYAHEVRSLRRPPVTVVLAADNLALNRVRPGDEALGFAGALLVAGSHTVVAATNRLGDSAAADAMRDLYRGLATGKPMAEALADAIAADPLRRPFICLGTGWERTP